MSFCPGVMSVSPKWPFLHGDRTPSPLGGGSRDACGHFLPLNWLLVSRLQFSSQRWGALSPHIFPLRTQASPTSWQRWVEVAARWTGWHSCFFFFPWPPPHTRIYRSRASASWNSGLRKNSEAIQLLPWGHLVRLFAVAHFFVWPVLVFSNSIGPHILPMGNTTPQ